MIKIPLIPLAYSFCYDIKSCITIKFYVPATVCSLVGASMDDVRLTSFPLSLDFVGEDEKFLLGDVEAGTVTPGITGRLAGGVFASGDWRICIKKFLSYTIRVPV